MRPSDENQHGSTRPTMLSGARRHVGGDDNILARLERDAARHASGNRSRAVWYATAALLVLMLMLLLAWTAYDNASAVHVVPMTRVPADSSAASHSAMTPGAPSVPGPDAVPTPPVRAPVPAGGSTEDNTASTLPPLVLLPHQPMAASKAPAPVSVAAPVSAPVTVPAQPATVERAPPAQAASARLGAGTHPTATLPTGGAHLVQKPVQQRVQQPVQRAVQHPVLPPVLRPALRASLRPALRPAGARQARPQTVPMQADAGIDTDVAVLSAIIIHDSAHAEEKAQLEAAAVCLRIGAKKCRGHAGGSIPLTN